MTTIDECQKYYIEKKKSQKQRKLFCMIASWSHQDETHKQTKKSMRIKIRIMVASGGEEYWP